MMYSTTPRRAARTPPCPTLLALCAAAVCAPASALDAGANPAEVLEVQQVEVIGTTPLPGSGVKLRDLPANAQVFTGGDLRRQRANSLTEFLEQNPTSISVNAAQGNPYQPDVNFRGFTASPLLGTPQGISGFYDGVRINEPFGDSVNWDLLPQSAISSIQLIPGSNPAFGLNTLGGAIALYTKSGASEYPDAPGGSVTASGGSFGRRTLGFEAGGRHGAWDWFLTGNDADDHGWAMHNPSRVRQVFAKLGWQDDESDLDLSFTGANNRLEGTQTLPTSFTDIRDAYTYPDINTNRAALLTLKGSTALTPTLLLSGNGYLRRYTNGSFNSNLIDPGDAVDPQPLATNDLAQITQISQGLGMQIADSGRLAGLRNLLTVGVSADRGRARFTRSSQPAVFNADRGTVATGDFVPDTDSDLTTTYLGAFFSDSLGLTPEWTLSLAGRANRADVQIKDRSGSAPELNGRHRFSRFNPAVGLSYNPDARLTAYASYNQGMRSPTAIELTCADPNAPCKLPNNFLSDPPLKAVLSTTFEIGVRGKPAPETNWSAAIFRTDLQNDLQFIASNSAALNAGYFQNVGGTRRQGVELSGTSRVGRLGLTLRYSFLDATYRSGFAENSPANSAADANGTIQILPGNRMTGLPRHSVKMRLDVDATPDWNLAANALLSSSQRARGDENNLDAHGPVPGYAILNLDTRYRIDAALQFFARIDNVFDRRYANFALIGDNFFGGPGHAFDPANAHAEQFRGYGVPRGVWAGLQYQFR